jgi:hypothetical protein
VQEHLTKAIMVEAQILVEVVTIDQAVVVVQVQ